MKYLKTFEVLNKKTVDPNEIYVFNVADKKYPIYLAGKINIHDNDYAPKMNVFRLDNGNKECCYIKKQYWRTIRIATEEEKEFYNYYNNINKYNV